MGKNGGRAARIILFALAAISVGGTILSAPARAAGLFGADAVGLTGGYSNSVAIYGAALSWNLPGLDAKLGGHGFSTRLVAQLAYWDGRERPTPYRYLWDTSLTPMLRWSNHSDTPPHFYVEGGIGVRVLSDTRINNDRIFSTAFQFGEQGGVGLAFGPDDAYEVGVYVQHVSNANIKRPNDGLTYPGVVFRAALR